MQINRGIFRQYDIRGNAYKDLTKEVTEAISQTFAAYIAKKNISDIIVGRDNRLSSPRLRDIVVKNLISVGMNVIDIGEVISPMFYFACHHLNIKAGIMITASHNPGEDNGFKLYSGTSTIYGDEIQLLADMIEREEYLSGRPEGILSKQSIENDYLADITGKVSLGPKPLKVVIDCGNGTAGFIAPRLFKELGCEVTELFCDSDPTFPNHHPDPVKVDNCQDLIRVVKEKQADLGLGFDGDGDRLGVVSSSGDIIWGDKLMILFWREILPKYPGADCIVEIKCSQALIDEINKLGGKPIMYKTGHSLMKAKMKEIGAIFTGELSGHIFFADEHFGYDDALYAAARLLRIISHSGQSLDELLQDINIYHSTPELRIKSTDTGKFAVVEKVKAHFKDRYQIIDIDGARIVFPHGWGLVRASNTGPELILRFESSTPEGLEQIQQEILGFLDSVDLSLDR